MQERSDSSGTADDSRRGGQKVDGSAVQSEPPEGSEEEPEEGSGEEPEEEPEEGSGELDDEEGDPSRDPRRAAFLDDLPDTAELRPLIAAFVDGDYARLRALERALTEQTADPDVLSAARELVERTEPDPLSKKLLGLSILFFLFIVGWVYLHHAQ